MNNTISIKTLGCKLNQYESSMIASSFVKRGWQVRPFGEKVDIVIVNTCSVTDKSEKKCRNYIRQGARFSRIGKSIITGCMSEVDRDFLMGMDEVGAVFGNREKENIHELVMDYVKGIESAGEPITVNMDEVPFSDLVHLSSRTREFVKIQDGCDGDCSYCIVPRVRGNPVSRDISEIIEHAGILIGRGCPEIVLTGITIGKYINEGNDLSTLVKKLSALDGDFRIRITSIEPNHVTDKLIDLFEHDRVCNHIHLPLQSGSDRILKLMKRPYGEKDYRSIIERIKSKHPFIAIGTDIIIGFPGEDEADFSRSMEMIEWAGFSYVHQFSFSPRRGTEAAGIENTLMKNDILNRSKRMKDIATDTGIKYARMFEGKVLESVIEKNRKHGTLTSISDNYLKIKIDNSLQGRNCAGKMKMVKLLRVDKTGNYGILQD
ncbi:tRNA (N(6)-L-threonylcarbamoyladenosine(37)-C(2))-methylthiotransferase MtaB [Spirochaetota bacterium]